MSLKSTYRIFSDCSNALSISTNYYYLFTCNKYLEITAGLVFIIINDTH